MSWYVESRTGGYRNRLDREALLMIYEVSKALREDVQIVTFAGEMESPWICFDVGRRRFGIWRPTMNLYEADEHGAMGEDPIPLRSLWG